jgi:hypothetical protein
VRHIRIHLQNAIIALLVEQQLPALGICSPEPILSLPVQDRTRTENRGYSRSWPHFSANWPVPSGELSSMTSTVANKSSSGSRQSRKLERRTGSDSASSNVWDRDCKAHGGHGRQRLLLFVVTPGRLRRTTGRLTPTLHAATERSHRAKPLRYEDIWRFWFQRRDFDV